MVEVSELDAEAAARVEAFRDSYKNAKLDRDVAVQIEEVIIRGATDSSLASWSQMEADMRALFARNGFDLDKQQPPELARRMRAHPLAARWADLLELWVAARAQMSMLGGPAINAANMQPWADALYVIDADPIRTGIRRFLYERQRNTDQLDPLVAKANLTELPPRTLAWLSNVYIASKQPQRADEIIEIGLDRYPHDLMLTFDFAYTLKSQEKWQRAVRLLHRCLALRSDVPGLWLSLAEALEKMGEADAAKKARAKAELLAAKR